MRAGLALSLITLLAACGSRTPLSEGFDGAPPSRDAATSRDAGRDAGTPTVDAGPPCAPGEEARALYAAINPTGDPIGGGLGYRRGVEAADVDARVRDADGLERALSALGPGAVIWIEDDATIDLTGRPIALPEGVTLASGRARGRGALLLQTDPDGAPMITTAGAGARLTGLRLRGPDPQRGERRDAHAAIGVDARHGLELDDCELWAWPGAAVRVAARGVFVHHADFHHQRAAGRAASVRLEEAGTARVEACRFDYARHHLEARSAAGQWEVTHSHVLPHGADARFLSVGDEGRAASGALVATLLEEDSDVDLAIGGDPPGVVSYLRNWTQQEDLMDAVRLDTERAAAALRAEDNRFRVRTDRLLPRAVPVASPPEGTAPLEVTFDGSASAELGTEGCALRTHRWTFGEGATVEPPVSGVRVSHRYDRPGRYLATLAVDNAQGVQGRAHVPVLVRPEAEGRWLTLWVKDSHTAGLGDLYAIEVVVDGAVVWTRDVGDRGGEWEHVMVDVTAFTADAGPVQVGVRLTALTGVVDRARQINDVFVWIDDLHLFGGRVVNGDYEDGANAWVLEESGSTLYLAGSSLAEARSGDRSLVLGVGFVDPTVRPDGPAAGSYVQVSQRFLLE